MKSNLGGAYNRTDSSKCRLPATCLQAACRGQAGRLSSKLVGHFVMNFPAFENLRQWVQTIQSRVFLCLSLFPFIIPDPIRFALPSRRNAMAGGSDQPLFPKQMHGQCPRISRNKPGLAKPHSFRCFFHLNPHRTPIVPLSCRYRAAACLQRVTCLQAVDTTSPLSFNFYVPLCLCPFGGSQFLIPNWRQRRLLCAPDKPLIKTPRGLSHFLPIFTLFLEGCLFQSLSSFASFQQKVDTLTPPKEPEPAVGGLTGLPR